MLYTKSFRKLQARPANTFRGGFTLMELLIYIGAAVLVLIGILSLILLLTRSWLTVRARATVEENIRIAVERMRLEVEAADRILSPSLSPTITADGPVAYWRLDETTGTIARDLTANQNNGSYVGGVTLNAASGVSDSNSAADFNGSTGYISVPDTNNSLDLGAAGTVEAWVRLDLINGWHGIVVKVATVDQNFAGTLNYAMEIDDTNHVHAYFGYGGTYDQITSNTALVANRFYHVAFVWGVPGSPAKAIYIDGVLDKQTGGAPPPPLTGNLPLYIGRYGGVDGLGNPIDPFDGIIDEVAVYNYGLSEDQVKRHYNEGAGDHLILDRASGAGSPATYSGYAWSETLGWISFNCTGQSPPWDCASPPSPYTNYAVTRTLDDLNGFAMTQNTGFLSFNCRSSPNSNSCTSSDYRVTVDAKGEYHGWAWGDQIGWVSLNCADRSLCSSSNYKVYETNNETGSELHGWAWSEHFGWISFNCADRAVCGTSNYKVVSGLAGSKTTFSVLNGAWSVGVAGQGPQNLTDYSNVLIAKCGDQIGYFKLVLNPAPARPSVGTCFLASYRGTGNTLASYSATTRSTFQLR